MNTSLVKLACWLAAIASCSASCSAHAQSAVTVYGLVDMNVGATTQVDESGDAAVRVSSGGMNSSRLGFLGKEELGNGLHAVFQLEMGIAADTGVADSPLFKRQATVGLEGRFGSLLVGRAFTSVYDFVLPYDPMGYAPMYSWAPAGNASGDSRYGMALAFDNMLKYAGKAGNLSFGASYGAGERPGTAEGAKLALAANYARGPYSVVATWERIRGTRGAAGNMPGDTRAWHLGAMFSRGPLKLQAAMRDYRQEAASALQPDVRARLYWFGANYAIAPRTTVTGAVYLQDVQDVPAQTDADPVMLVGRVKYALSPRTDLYATAAYTRARHGRLVSLARDEPGFGSSQRSIMAGIQHRF